MRILLFFSIISLTAVLQFGCHKPIKFSYSLPGIDSMTLTEEVSINHLVHNYKELHGSYIKTEGTFYLEPEQFGIFSDGLVFSDNREGFWLEMNRDLVPKNDLSLIHGASGQRVIIKGRIDTTEHGHLGQYLATIKNIYFFKTE